MSSEFFQSVTYDNHDDFSYFHQILFHYFEDYLMTKTDLMVR